MQQPSDEVRCGECNRLLAKGEAQRLTVKCPRCGTLNHIITSGPAVTPEKTAKP